MLTAGEQPNAAESGSPPTAEPMEFLCPGESRPISLSVHLARLAAGYPACGDCASRHCVNGLPEHVVRRINRTPAAVPESLLHDEGLRGRYVNQLTAETISRLVAHALNVAEADRESEASGPMRVLFGCDGRPSSPELAISAVGTLRRNGCEITDVGCVTRPEFDYAVSRRRPELGVFLTGGTFPEIWTGLDLLDRQGNPWCSTDRLHEIVRRMPEMSSRLSRSPGSYQPLAVTGDYRRRLGLLFHALRPFRLVVGCQDAMVTSLLKSLLIETPCSLQVISQVSPSRIGEAVGERHADMGFLISRDGRGFLLIDEVGEFVPVAALVALLAEETRRCRTPSDGNPHGDGLVLRTAGEIAGTDIPGVELFRGSEAALLELQDKRELPVVGDTQGRIWFHGEAVRCDALQTLARTLQAVSRSDATVSQRTRR